MFSEARHRMSRVLTIGLVSVGVASCSISGKIRELIGSGVKADIAIPGNVPEENEPEAVQSSVREHVEGEPIIMNAELDEDTGEMVAVDVIDEAKVVARFNNVSERLGQVSISFDIVVPASLLSSDLQLSFSPVMHIGSEDRHLEMLHLTGAGYRGQQLKGYQRYRDFLASIVTDTTDLIMMNQLELFIRRYYPETFAMKRDSSVIPEPTAVNLFGVTQKQALTHYSMTLKRRVNDWKLKNRDKMYRKYVKDPMSDENVRLDTIIDSGRGDLIYRYVQSFRTIPGLKKVTVGMNGSVRRFGEKICDLPAPDSLTYYISSLSTLADQSVKYKTIVKERVVKDKTLASIVFKAGRSEVDTTLESNAAELERIRQCVLSVMEDGEMVLDSLVVSAGCSPEGPIGLNNRLSAARSAAVRNCLSNMSESIADSLLRTALLSENWQELDRIVASDKLLTPLDRQFYADASKEKNPDRREMLLRKMKGYGYMKSKLYPRLRTVSFDFFLHRKGMVKDTVHTTEIDTAYMAGVEALRQLDYAKAVEILRPYRDYNAALSYASGGYDHSSWAILEELPDVSANICYLKALVLTRLNRLSEAVDYYRKALEMEPSLRFRANLDPEMNRFVKQP